MNRSTLLLLLFLPRSGAQLDNSIGLCGTDWIIQIQIHSDVSCRDARRTGRFKVVGNLKLNSVRLLSVIFVKENYGFIIYLYFDTSG